MSVERPTELRIQKIHGFMHRKSVHVNYNHCGFLVPLREHKSSLECKFCTKICLSFYPYGASTVRLRIPHNMGLTELDKERVNEIGMMLMMIRKRCKSKVKNVVSSAVPIANEVYLAFSSFRILSLFRQLNPAAFGIELFMLLFAIYHIVHQF